MGPSLEMSSTMDPQWFTVHLQNSLQMQTKTYILVDAQRSLEFNDEVDIQTYILLKI